MAWAPLGHYLRSISRNFRFDEIASLTLGHANVLLTSLFDFLICRLALGVSVFRYLVGKCVVISLQLWPFVVMLNELLCVGQVRSRL